MEPNCSCDGEASFTPSETGECSLLMTFTLEEAKRHVERMSKAIAEVGQSDAHVQLTVQGELLMEL